MPKGDVGTPRWVSKQIKSRGLQKLRWYCQLCEKQCKDENGFKCHLNSDSHLRQMKLFENNSRKLLDDYSRKFEYAFMRLMRTRYSRTKVLANTVYNDIVHDKNHIHMNATIWTTLTEFIHYLSNTNKCIIEKSDKGWYIQYIDHERNKRDEELKTKRTKEIERSEQNEKIIEMGSKRMTSIDIPDSRKLPTILLRNCSPHEEKISFELDSRKYNRRSNELTQIQSLFQLEQEFSVGEKKKDKIGSKFTRNRSSSLSREGY
ncbi:hypothetical protein FG386_001599 [Cryptosporidium ryanae]|uniref:uncharacterized protein n=1 Tax=Cryptosporidium ryanae TaxID=515981 RepID=UPI003519DA8F|nr:hypothetical protein FG386_001599 [Cryptosporidium ryanae]